MRLRIYSASYEFVFLRASQTIDMWPEKTRGEASQDEVEKNASTSILTNEMRVVSA